MMFAMLGIAFTILFLVAILFVMVRSWLKQHDSKIYELKNR